MVPRLLRRLARLSRSTGGDDGTQTGQALSTGRLGRAGPDRGPLPASWVRMHVWWRDQGRCGLCGEREGVWFGYIAPVREESKSIADNIRLICERCKRSEKAAPTRRRKKLGA